ncbi:hypothetical protein [Nonlabens sp. Asnod2-A12]|uniref:hypothetical protein n=1 Tax=Nonlabens sp. Asnod2-A12 TaxID=3160578 RepID=UPI00386D87FE
MKTIQHFINFIVLSVLFVVSVSAGNVTFSDHLIEYPIEDTATVQAASSYHHHLFIGANVPSIVHLSAPERSRLTTDHYYFHTTGLLNRSSYLTLNQGSKTIKYDYIFIHHSFIKDIIFPFHSFW